LLHSVAQSLLAIPTLETNSRAEENVQRDRPTRM
jgi:hypothetical protein